LLQKEKKKKKSKNNYICFMQTFLISSDPIETAKLLDYKRLGKQRTETVQILNILLDQTGTRGWRNHPAVRMWKGYEAFLVKVYLKAMIEEWKNRGYKSPKCDEHYKRLYKLVEHQEPIAPSWFSNEFFTSHKSNLVRKNSDYYKPLFNIDGNLPYVWPR